MSPKLLLGVVAALVVGATGWFLLNSGGDAALDDEQGSIDRTVANEVERTADSGALTAVAGADSDREAGRASISTEDAGAHEGDLRTNVPEDRRVLVTVEVLAPLGAPPDDDLVVAAWSDEELEDGPPDWTSESARRRWRRRSSLNEAVATFDEAETADEVRWCIAEPEADGTFVVALDRKASRASLSVGGRFLYLASPESFEMPSLPERIVLEPQIGTWVVGRVAGVNDTADGEVRLRGGTMGRGRRGGGNGFVDRRAPLDADGRFEFRGVRSDLVVEVVADVPTFAPSSAPVDEMEPGARVDVVVDLVPGGAIEGRVVDPAGEAVAGAEVRANERGAAMFGRGGPERKATTTSDGSFRIEGLGSGAFTLRASLEGWRDARSDEDVAVEEASTRTNVLLTMDPGLVITGRVLLPNDRPAAGAEVRLEQSSGASGDTSRRGPFGPRRPSRERQEVTAEADGTFRFRALADTPARVAASYEDASGRSFAGIVSDVAPRDSSKAKPIELRVAPTKSIEGRVVDDRGEPVTAFEVRAAREGFRSDAGAGDGVRESFESPDGTFALAGASDGVWTVTVRAEGHRLPDEERKTIEVPSTEGPLTITLVRLASVSGVVTDPAGTPVAGARVKRATDGGPFGGFGGRDRGVETDSEGAFTLPNLDAGSLRIEASHDDWAPSAPVTVEAVAGGESAGVVLALRRGGVIRGIVRDESGAPWSGRRILYSLGTGPMAMFGAEESVTSDAAGEFTFTGVAPGTWTVTAAPGEAETFRTMREANDESAFFAMMAQNLTGEVTVEDGGEAWIELGAEPREPVVVFGEVTRAGEPVTEGAVTFILEGAELFSNMRRAELTADGTYRVELDRPGPYLVSVERRGTGGLKRNGFVRDVSRGAEERIDLALPEGGVSGRVLTPDGEPAAGERVTLELDSSFAFARFDPRATTTSADGRYEILDLDPGTYTLRVGGRGFGLPGAGGGSSTYARTSVDDIAVTTDSVTAGVDVRLSGSGRVLGKVVDVNGEPVSGATIFVRDSAGRSVDSISTIRTNASGAFTYDRISPGTYVVSARTSSGAAPDEADVRVVENEDTSIELKVEEATTLVITTTDEEGEPLRANLSVKDADGREFTGLVGMDVFRQMGTGMSTTEQRVGPLPPGRYTVTATDGDGRTEKKKVTVRNKAESRVRIKFED